MDVTTNLIVGLVEIILLQIICDQDEKKHMQKELHIKHANCDCMNTNSLKECLKFTIVFSF